MNKFTLQPNEIRQVPLSGRYLVARTIIGTVVVSDPTIGLPEFIIKQSDNVEFPESRSVTVRNDGATVATVELQSSPVKIFSNDGGSVKISGGSIDSINEAINVNATAVVENGTVISLSPDYIAQVTDKTLAAGATVSLLSASPAAKRRVVIIQNISDVPTILRVGESPNATAGAVLFGSINGISTLEIETTAQINAHNTSANPAKVAIMWSYK